MDLPPPHEQEQQRPHQTAPKLYRYRHSTAASPSSSLTTSPPLLFSKATDQAYALLTPIVGPAPTRPHMQVLLAAPIIVVSPPPPPPSTDVLFYPHPTERVVVKQIRRAWVRQLEQFPGSDLVGEVQALLRLQRTGVHPYVVPLLDMMVDDEFYYLVFPYLDGGELFSLVTSAEGGRGLEEKECKVYFAQIVKGLLHLKHHGLAHGDVSLENIMLTTKGNPAAAATMHDRRGHKYVCQLIDLGLARTASSSAAASSSSSSSSAPQTVGAALGRRIMGGKGAYAAPEVVRGTVEDWHAADIWSLGLCLYNMLTSMAIYTAPHDAAFAILATQGGSEYVLSHHLSTYRVPLPLLAVDLIAAMLQANPAARPTLEQVAQHVWLCGGQQQQQVEREVQHTTTARDTRLRAFLNGVGGGKENV